MDYSKRILQTSLASWRFSLAKYNRHQNVSPDVAHQVFYPDLFVTPVATLQKSLSNR
jgi:hypothetical protein